jgi:hypothetical protein
MVPPLMSGERIVHQGAYRVWNRRARVPVDLDAWRRGPPRAPLGAPAVPLRTDMATVDAGLAAWLRGHRHLVPTDVERGETGMALLILWEVDHGRPFPAGVEGTNVAATLASFCRRLRARATQDDQLNAWLEVKEMQFPLAPGLPPSHQLRWSVRVERPSAGAPVAWYQDFVLRWRAYLASLAAPSTRRRTLDSNEAERPPKRPRTTPSSELLAADVGAPEAPLAVPPPQRGRLAASGRRRQRAVPAAPRVSAQRPEAAEASPPAGGAPRLPTTAPRRVRQRSPPEVPPAGEKRQCGDLRRWLQPRGSAAPAADVVERSVSSVGSGHGRATTGSTT